MTRRTEYAAGIAATPIMHPDTLPLKRCSQAILFKPMTIPDWTNRSVFLISTGATINAGDRWSNDGPQCMRRHGAAGANQ